MSVATRSFFDAPLGIPVSIAVSKPEGFPGMDLPAAKPSWKAVTKYREDHDWDEYSTRYERQLAGRRTALLTTLDEIIDSYGSATFCCWCKEAQTCHRSLFADWLETQGWVVDRG